MKYLFTALLFSMLLLNNACKNASEQQAEHVQDSLEIEDEKTLEMIDQNEDSLMKAKEAELKEMYGN